MLNLFYCKWPLNKTLDPLRDDWGSAGSQLRREVKAPKDLNELIVFKPKSPLTFSFEVHAPEHQWTDELALHLPLEVHKDGGQVAVGVVGDAGGGDGLEELGLREFPGQCAQVLVDEGAQRDAGMRDEQREKSS